VSRAAGATNSVARAQRPKPQREGPRVAVRQPASTRIPRIAEEEFGRARDLFDRKKYAAAADGFQRVITILSDGELTPSASTLRSMATEMVFVSRAALASAPGPQAHMAGDASVIEPVPLQQSIPAPPAPDLSPDPRVYAAGDAGVIEPVPLKQYIPPRPAPDLSPDPRVYVAGDAGVIEPVPLKQYIPPHPAPDVSPSDLSVLELLIDSRGAVEWVHLRNPKNRYRDAWWLSAAKAWRFRPALKDGQPVKFLERILITTFTPSDPQ